MSERTSGVMTSCWARRIGATQSNDSARRNMRDPSRALPSLNRMRSQPLGPAPLGRAIRQLLPAVIERERVSAAGELLEIRYGRRLSVDAQSVAHDEQWHNGLRLPGRE